jgi:8-oxo-dGTP pyrophosphatase MutT (NUDIX family)
MSDRRALHTWERLAAELVYQCRIFSLRRERSRFSRDDVEHEFHVLECPDWVNVVPLTPDGDVVMVRQFRHGIQDVTLEVPGGMVDAHDPSPLVAARREMREESGFDGDRIEALGTIHPNPAIQANRCHSFVAYDVERRYTPMFDSTEETEVVLVPHASVPALLRDGVITHALVVVAFEWLWLRDGRP